MAELPDDQVAELRRLEAEASPGPWFAQVDSDGPCCESACYIATTNGGDDLEARYPANPEVVAVTLLQTAGPIVVPGDGRYDENTHLIAAMRNALVPLLDERDALRAELDRSRTFDQRGVRLLEVVASERDAVLLEVEQLRRDMAMANEAVRNSVLVIEQQSAENERLKRVAEAARAIHRVITGEDGMCFCSYAHKHAAEVALTTALAALEVKP